MRPVDRAGRQLHWAVCGLSYPQLLTMINVMCDGHALATHDAARRYGPMHDASHHTDAGATPPNPIRRLRLPLLRGGPRLPSERRGSVPRALALPFRTSKRMALPEARTRGSEALCHLPTMPPPSNVTPPNTQV